MKKNRIIPIIISMCGYLVCAAGAYVIPTVIFDPANRSSWFMYKVLWAQVLLLVSWGYILVFHLRITRGSSRDETGMRMSPARGFVVFTYAFFSIMLLALSGLIKGNLLFERIHLAFHVLLSVLLVVLLVLTVLASTSDTEEGETDE